MLKSLDIKRVGLAPHEDHKQSLSPILPLCVVIGIGGGTASGKTTLARTLLERFRPRGAEMLAFDSYYRVQSHLSYEERCGLNFDAPEALDFDLLYDHVQSLLRAESISVPAWYFARHDRKGAFLDVPPSRLLIIEGILALHDPRLVELMDFKVFLDAAPEVRFARRLERDIRERGRTEDSVRSQWAVTVEPMYQTYCAPSASNADMIICDRADWESVAERIEQLITPP